MKTKIVSLLKRCPRCGAPREIGEPMVCNECMENSLPSHGKDRQNIMATTKQQQLADLQAQQAALEKEIADANNSAPSALDWVSEGTQAASIVLPFLIQIIHEMAIALHKNSADPATAATLAKLQAGPQPQE